ncbi:hypothetical protein PACILC2_22260 [Paenibacillus cisolokensis]|uniref:Uncharacterized protein n=1 Tax=Paenibacillus cisolokensis TaxID=1658519 RepID=A0ABQ4N653_9BACL|nr:hypothetical protein [Paenibacillus cisolokensis]GIQ63658.1 hypothetical protein PACILC2_22260 [Paenibacillus cisolokensis]
MIYILATIIVAIGSAALIVLAAFGIMALLVFIPLPAAFCAAFALFVLVLGVVTKEAEENERK